MAVTSQMTGRLTQICDRQSILRNLIGHRGQVISKLHNPKKYKNDCILLTTCYLARIPHVKLSLVLEVLSHGPLDGSNDDASASKHDVKPLQRFQCVEMEGVEVTTEPVMASFKMRVCSAGSGALSHGVINKHEALQKLYEARIRELHDTTQLPKLPPEQPSQQAESSVFSCSVWIAHLACNSDASETYSFQNFFQLSEAHSNRNRACSATKSVPSRKPVTAQASVLVGGGSAFCPQQTEPSLDHRVRFSSCSRGKRSLFS